MFGTMSDQTVYTAVNLADSSDRFTVHAELYLLAQSELLNKLGYDVVDYMRNFTLVDADTGEIEQVLNSNNMIDVLTEALAFAKWKIQEPVTLIGGALTGGFGFDENQPR